MNDDRCIGDILAELADVMAERDENEKLFKAWRSRCLKAEKTLAENRVQHREAIAVLAEKISAVSMKLIDTGNERDRLQRVVDVVQDAFVRPNDNDWKICHGALVVLADALDALEAEKEAVDG